jgi:hypothetical protein
MEKALLAGIWQRNSSTEHQYRSRFDHAERMSVQDKGEERGWKSDSEGTREDERSGVSGVSERQWKKRTCGSDMREVKEIIALDICCCCAKLHRTTARRRMSYPLDLTGRWQDVGGQD